MPYPHETFKINLSDDSWHLTNTEFQGKVESQYQKLKNELQGEIDALNRATKEEDSAKQMKIISSLNSKMLELNDAYNRLKTLNTPWARSQYLEEHSSLDDIQKNTIRIEKINEVNGTLKRMRDNPTFRKYGVEVIATQDKTRGEPPRITIVIPNNITNTNDIESIMQALQTEHAAISQNNPVDLVVLANPSAENTISNCTWPQQRINPLFHYDKNNSIFGTINDNKENKGEIILDATDPKVIKDFYEKNKCGVLNNKEFKIFDVTGFNVTRDADDLVKSRSPQSPY